jgi:hypothetical protein
VNRGKSIEDVIEYLCTRSFFADFTFRSPKFYKSGGQEKEAADLLIVFNGNLIAIQIKTRELDSPSEKISPIEQQRLTKIIEKTVRQFHALTEAMNEPDFTFVNGRGVSVAFEKEKINSMVLIVVFAPIWRNQTEPATMRFRQTCYAEETIPLHIFTLDQFSLLVTLLDTLPDFFLYLDARWMFHREKLIPMDGDPIDEYFFITFERKEVVTILEKRKFINLEGMRQWHEKSLEQLEKQEQPSYLIDNLVEQLYAGVGSEFTPNPDLVRNALQLEEPGSLNSYRSVIPYLVKLNRSQRCHLAEQILIRQQRCDSQGISFGAVKFDKHEEGYVVLASKSDRFHRQVELFNIGRAAGFKMKLKNVICIAAEPLESESSSYEAMFIDLSKMKLDETVLKITNEFLGDAKQV